MEASEEAHHEGQATGHDRRAEGGCPEEGRGDRGAGGRVEGGRG